MAGCDAAECCQRGVVNSSGICSKADLKKILDFAFSSGMAEIDTAVSYGESEKNLGSVGVGRFKISSKIPYLDVVELQW